MQADRGLPVKLLVREVMNSPPITGKADEDAASLAKKMVEFKVGSVVIMDGKEVIGVVTDGDLVNKVVAKGLPPEGARARDVMSSPLHTIEAEKDLTEAARMMRKFGIKRLGVTYKGEVVGMVSMTDILSVTPELLDILSEKARILRGGRGKGGFGVSGYCDTCNQWSDSLMEIDGKFVCEECTGETSKGES
ncbi:MAG: CBS domain-containing protein [Nitrososphaerota archaeon]|nr:CBS domain-containing protein [Nitrososphaerota archaeon]MDG6939436.1 CBS domain-containing protein [Nitrososphaerota archaeon]